MVLFNEVESVIQILPHPYQFVHLTSLCLEAMQISDATAVLVSRFISLSLNLRFLSISNCELSPNALTSMLDAIGRSENLERFSFQCIEEDDEEEKICITDMLPLANMISATRSLRSLDLVAAFGDTIIGYEEFWAAIASNQTIHTLKFSEESISSFSQIPVDVVVKALEANKSLRNVDLFTTMNIEPSTCDLSNLKRAQYDLLKLRFDFLEERKIILEHKKPESKRVRMILEAYRLVKYSRFLVGSNCYKTGFRFPFEILIRIFTRGMITEQDWVPEQLEVITRCLLKRSTYGLISDSNMSFNETSLFVVCNRILSQMSK